MAIRFLCLIGILIGFACAPSTPEGQETSLAAGQSRAACTKSTDCDQKKGLFCIQSLCLTRDGYCADASLPKGADECKNCNRGTCDGKFANCAGDDATCNGAYSVCQGRFATCNGDNSLCSGREATCSGNQSVCSGTCSICTGNEYIETSNVDPRACY